MRICTLERGNISGCKSLAVRYADCIRSQKLFPKDAGPDQKLEPPPACEMESAVYGQCMANTLDYEVRRSGHRPTDTEDIRLDTDKCRFTLAAFEKCMAGVDPKSMEQPQTSSSQANTYYWMSSIYWQAPSKTAPPSGT